jgi:hypothetical protein
MAIIAAAVIASDRYVRRPIVSFLFLDSFTAIPA